MDCLVSQSALWVQKEKGVLRIVVSNNLPCLCPLGCDWVIRRCSTKPSISILDFLDGQQKAHPTNQLTSQHLWPFALLCKSLTFSSLLSRLGSIHGANPRNCSFWLTPSFLAPCPVATHDHSTSPVHQVLKAIKCISCLKLVPGQGWLGVE